MKKFDKVYLDKTNKKIVGFKIVSFNNILKNNPFI